MVEVHYDDGSVFYNNRCSPTKNVHLFLGYRDTACECGDIRLCPACMTAMRRPAPPKCTTPDRHES